MRSSLAPHGQVCPAPVVIYRRQHKDHLQSAGGRRWRPGINPDESFEQAGPREIIYFKPEETRSAIATCGGLCPGINAVIRSIVMASHYLYGSNSIIGIRFGYSGLDPNNGYEPIDLRPEEIEDIHLEGGTILGSSRGGTEDMEVLVDTLARLRVNILYTVGGDGP